VPVLIGLAAFEESTNQGVAFVLDLTDRKHAEEARQELEEQWKAAFESNPTMYFIVDEAGVIVSVNPFGAGQLGYTVDELVGQPVLDVFHEPDRQAIQRHARACFEHPGRMKRWEARKIRKDGTMIWVRETGNAVFLKKRLVLLVICEDITEQRRAEEALRRSESYLAEAQRLTRTGTLVWDPAQARTIHCSGEVYKMFGLDPQKGIPAIAELLERVHPEDRERVTGDSRRGAGDKVGRVVDYRVSLPDGTVKYIHSIRYPLLNDAGDLVEFLGSLIDVTEQKRAEEELHGAETRFRTYVDHATDALFVRDAAGRVIDMNRRACESLGYTREELIGQLPGHFDRGADEKLVNEIERRLDGGELVEFESTHQGKDGTRFPVEVRIRPFWHGGHRFSLCLARDISDRKRAEAERERLRQCRKILPISTVFRLSASSPLHSLTN
jgi:PAS domain S-box-containing protein